MKSNILDKIKLFRFNFLVEPEYKRYLIEDGFLEDKPAISFATCGWLLYELGAYSFIYNTYDTENFIFGGGSGGALVAILAACGVDPKNPLALVEDAIKKSKSIKELNKLIFDNLHMFFDENSYKKANKRLFISITQLWPPKNRIITTFRSTEEMLYIVRVSCNVPGYNYKKCLVKGKRHLDGFFTSHLPRVNEKTITVEPFPLIRRNVDIWSKRGISSLSYRVFVPSVTSIKALYFRGYQDAQIFFNSGGAAIKDPRIDCLTQKMSISDIVKMERFLKSKDRKK